MIPSKVAIAAGLVAGMVLTGALVRAQPCGDANGDGKVTVVDAVNSLRAAADLSNDCTLERCDLNLDGAVTVADGVRTLRMAAELDKSTCTLEIGAGVVARTQGIMDVGVAVVPSTSATTAPATVQCPDGGSFDGTETTLSYVDCRDGDFVSNGVVNLTAVAGNADRQATFDDFVVVRVSTGETLRSSGTLVFSPRGTQLAVNGTIARSSNVLGEFTDAFQDVIADTAGNDVTLRSGTVVTTPSHQTAQPNGGPLVNVQSLRASIAGPQLTIVLTTFVGGAQEVVIVAGDIGLCDPCTTSSQCDAELACLPCSSDCTGTTRRCSVNFQNFAARCPDGLF
jgi:hypothetical protein